MPEKLFLLTNDDGIQSPGIQALKNSLCEMATVVVVAPETERSACGRSISLHRPLRIQTISSNEYSLDGTPVDCIHIAIKEILKDRRPDLVISGINWGANLGHDTIYSGTVSAALEASMFNIPAIALSEVCLPDDNGNRRSQFEFTRSAEIARIFLDRLIEKKHSFTGVLNINIPNHDFDGIRGIRLVTLGRIDYGNEIIHRLDPAGKPYFWIGGRNLQLDQTPGSDTWAVANNYIAITPLVDEMPVPFQPGLANFIESINSGFFDDENH